MSERSSSPITSEITSSAAEDDNEEDEEESNEEEEEEKKDVATFASTAEPNKGEAAGKQQVMQKEKGKSAFKSFGRLVSSC